ncbi:hypothetical protein CF319_g8064 [Tilletia indica]|nr:hypothetical protein CF319_g8064 [Tilletia indica]
MVGEDAVRASNDSLDGQSTGIGSSSTVVALSTLQQRIGASQGSGAQHQRQNGSLATPALPKSLGSQNEPQLVEGLGPLDAFQGEPPLNENPPRTTKTSHFPSLWQPAHRRRRRSFADHSPIIRLPAHAAARHALTRYASVSVRV